MKHCTDIFLVGLDHPLPEDPREGYFGTNKPPFVGCNNLVCFSCKKIVHHVDGRATKRAYLGPATLDAQELYDSPDPAASALLDPGSYHARARVYFCRCNLYPVSDFKPVRSTEMDWACAGHPE
jgi:hypothetical protein